MRFAREIHGVPMAGAHNPFFKKPLQSTFPEKAAAIGRHKLFLRILLSLIAVNQIFSNFL